MSTGGATEAASLLCSVAREKLCVHNENNPAIYAFNYTPVGSAVHVHELAVCPEAGGFAGAQSRQRDTLYSSCAPRGYAFRASNP